MTNMRK